MRYLLLCLLISIDVSATSPASSLKVPDLSAQEDLVLDFALGQLLRIQSGKVLVGWKYALKKPNCLLHAYDIQGKPIRGRLTISKGDVLKSKSLPQRAERLTGYLTFSSRQDFELNMICFGEIKDNRPVAFEPSQLSEIVSGTFKVLRK